MRQNCLRRIFSVRLTPPSPDSPDLFLITPARPLPRTLLSSEFVFVREDSSVPPLSQLYRGPYKVVDRKEKYFKLQIGSQQDNVSVDRLKPVFSDVKVSPALPPPQGRPPRRPPPPAANLPPPAANPPPPAANPPPPVRKSNKSVRFSLPPRAALLPRRFVSALLPMPLLGGSSVADQILRQHLLCSFYNQTKDVKSTQL